MTTTTMVQWVDAFQALTVSGVTRHYDNPPLSLNTADLPADYLRDGRRVDLSLADLFPKLSYAVIRQIGIGDALWQDFRCL